MKTIENLVQAYKDLQMTITTLRRELIASRLEAARLRRELATYRQQEAA